MSIVVPVYQLKSLSRGFVSRSSIKGAIESIKQHTCSNQFTFTPTNTIQVRRLYYILPYSMIGYLRIFLSRWV